LFKVTKFHKLQRKPLLFRLLALLIIKTSQKPGQKFAIYSSLYQQSAEQRSKLSAEINCAAKSFLISGSAALQKIELEFGGRLTQSPI
jgi:hypothetical protein